MKEGRELIPTIPQDNPIDAAQESMAEGSYNLVSTIIFEGLGSVSHEPQSCKHDIL